MSAALDRARADGHPVVGFYCLDETNQSSRAFGGAARWWLHQSLTRLAEALAAYNIPLILRQGPAEVLIPALVRETGARHLYWNRQYEAPAIDLGVDESIREFVDRKKASMSDQWY